MNTTFTTCATKAKQILNLLQGYTKGIRFTAILILLLMGVSNAWGWNSWNDKTIYFDNSLWASDDYTPQLLIGRYYTWGSESRGSSAMSLTKIQNTDLWYLKDFTYSNYTSQYFIANETTWGNEYGCDYDGCDNTPEHRYKYATHYTNSYNTDGDSKYNLFIPESKDNNASLAYYHNSNYSTLLNYNQTVQQHLSTNGNAYAASTASIATVKVSSYKLSNATTTAADSKTIASSQSSATCSAARTATVTYTVSEVKTGYKFVGWYDGDTQKSTSTTYTYPATGAKTITARFEKTYAVTISAGANGTVSPSGSQQVGSTSVTIKATANTGYKFKNWTITGGVVIANANNATTTITATATGTVEANFEEDLSSNWKLIGDNQTNSPFGDNYTYSSGKAMTKKSGHSTENNVYITLDIKHLPASYYGFKVATSNSDDQKYGYGQGEGHYITFNRSASNTQKQVYSGSQHELKFIPDALGEYEFRVNYPSNKYVYVTFPTAYAVTFGKGTGGGSVTAKYNSTSFNSGTKVQLGKTVTFTQTASAGYTFKEWNTKSDGTGTKLSTNDTYTHTVAATNTVYAIYTPNKYTVKFNANGGIGSMADQAFIYGTNQNLTANTFTNEGYSFNGWNTNAAGTGTKHNDQASVSNLTTTNNGTVNLYAQWTEIKHAITIKSNDNTFGTVTPSAASVGQHTAVSITATSKIDYVFKNWTATDGITIVDANNASTTIKATQAGTVTANFEKAKTTTVYLKPNAAWKQANARFAVYYWADGNKDAWSDMEDIDCNNEYYSAEIPSDCKGFQFVRMNGKTNTNTNGNVWNRTRDLTVPKDSKTMLDMSKVYLKPNGNWKTGGARFAAYFYVSSDGNKNTWVDMTITNEDGVYYCQYPSDQNYDNVTFGRMNGSTTANNWDNRWDQTNGMEMYSGANSFTIEEGQWGGNGNDNSGATGNWSYKFSEPAYDVTLHSSAFGEYGIVYNNTKYFSPKSGSVTYQIPIDATIKIFSTPYSNAYNGDVTVTKGGSTQDYASESTLTVDCNMTLDDNYKTIGTHVVYLAVPAGGTWIGTNGTNCLRALHNLLDPAKDTNAGETVTMEYIGDATIDGTSHTYYRCEVPAGYNTIRFEKRADAGKWSNTDLATKKLFYEIPLNSINCYRLSGIEDKFFIGLWEPAPGFDGDYRLLHVKEAGVSYPSDVIRAGTTEQIVSLHIYKEGAGDPYPKIELQKYDKTGGWVTTSTQKVKDISTIMNDSEKGAVWNFVVKVNNGAASVNYETDVERYTGDYYIRTNNAEGGWRNYTLSTNKMTFSSYAKAHSGFTHYFCRWIDIIDNSTEPGHNNNVKFIVANDYGAVLSNEYAGDTHTTTGGLLPEDANVRWAWDEVTNTPSRAYILGAYGANDIQNKNIVVTYNTNTEEILDDQENWIYEIDLKDINQGSQLSILQATYPSKDIQVTFKDAGVTKTETVTADQQIFASNLQMINADNDNHNTYTVRVMYDFKINKTLVMLLPDQGAKTGVDVFIERTDQGDATQVAATVTRDDPGYTIYATMTFTKDHLESTDASEWKRLYYWISFPFDVRISDVFGFGEYGKQWIIEYYDGAARAKNGYWLESDTYWKYISDTTYVAGKSNEDANGNPNNGVLVANKGYVLALARSIANQGLFKNGNEYVRLYFPSMNKIGSIDGDMQNVVTLLQEYPCTITGREAYDNNWHMIGVPSYADKNHTLTQDNLFYYYQYQPTDDTYKVTSAKGSQVEFKSLHAYFVQYAGTINWRNWATTPQQLAARRNTHSEQDTYSLRLELQRNGTYADQTFVQLKDESTTDYDMNIDLTKLMNSGTNIYTLAGEQRIQLAGSVIPVAETTIPVGVKVAAAGEYTLAMPDGTDGITALLIDYETNTTTDLLLSDYTVTLPKGSTENRFALIVKPRKTATRMENIGEGAKDADKYIIDGALYLQRDGKLYNAQGQIMR